MFFKRIFALIICSLLAVTLFSFKVFSESEYSQGDIVKFGRYPQSLVSDEAVIESLSEMLGDEWIDYGYYYGDDSAGSEEMHSFMFYQDITFAGSEYRAVTFSEYRPINNYYKPSAGPQYQAGYTVDKVYYFKYEPVE